VDGGPIPVLAAMDHEETGSVSTTGALGPFLEVVLERLVEARGGAVDARARAYAGSVMASADLAHAVHRTIRSGTTRGTGRWRTAARCSR